MTTELPSWAESMVEPVAVAIKNARALPGTNPVAKLSDVDRRAATAALAEALPMVAEHFEHAIQYEAENWSPDARLIIYRASTAIRQEVNP